MANNSLQNQLMGQLVQSQIKKAMYNVGRGDEYEAIQQRQRDAEIAQLQAEYDAWAKKNSNRTTKGTTAKAAAKGSNTDNGTTEKAAKKQQEPQRFMTAEERKAYKELTTIKEPLGGFDPEKSYANTYGKKRMEKYNMNAGNGYDNGTPLDFSEKPDWGVGDSINQDYLNALMDKIPKKPNTTTWTEEQLKDVTDRQKANDYLKTQYQMTEAERKEAQQIAKEQLGKFKGKKNSELTEQEQADKDLYNDLKKKASPINNILQGVTRLPFAASKLLTDIGLDVGGTAAEIGAGMLDEFTGNQDTAKYRSAVRDAVEAKKQQVEGNYKDMRVAQQNANTQNPYLYGAGNAATQLATYYATGPIFDKAAAGAGVTSAAGKYAVNQLGQNAQDILLDTLPMLGDLKADGELSREDKQELAKNMISNAAFNIAVPEIMGGLQKSNNQIYGDLVGKLGNNADIFKEFDGNGALKNAPDYVRELAQAKQGVDAQKAANAANELPILGRTMSGPTVNNAANNLPILQKVGAQGLGDIPDLKQFLAESGGLRNAPDLTKGLLDIEAKPAENMADVFKGADNAADIGKAADNAADVTKTTNSVLDKIIEQDADAASKLKINEINAKGGKKRYQIVYQNGNKSIPIESGKTYKTLEEAQNGLRMNLQYFAEKTSRVADQIPNAKSTTEQLWSELEQGSREMFGNGTKAAGGQNVHAGEYNEQGQKLSRLHESLQNTEMLTDAQKQAYADKNGFWYDPDNERTLAQQAQDAVANDLEGIYEKYAQGGKALENLGGQAAHEMFTASYDYTKMAQEALKNGDEELAKLYNQKARNIMLNAREAATKGGQFNAAIAYYARTPQGYVNKAYDILDNQISDFKAKNPKLSQGIDELSKHLSKQLEGVDVDSILTGADEAAKDALRRQVLDNISDYVAGFKNKQLKDAFKNLSLSEVDELIASKYAGDIAKQLDMFSMGSFGVKPETIDKVMDIFAEAEQYGINSKDYYKLEQEAYNLLANDLMDGKSLEDKINAWRYFSMLSGTKTHIKNNLGNLTNNVLTGIKNTLAAAIEASADKIVKATGGEGIQGGRTKSVLNPISGADRDLISEAAKDFDNNAYRQYKQGGNKWINVSNEMAAAGDTFKHSNIGGRILNKVTGFNSDLLDVEDIIAGKAKYQTSLAGFLKANGADASIFKATDEASKELLEQGRAFALMQANEATFHQSNAFANWFSNSVKSAKGSSNAALKGVGYALDTTIPFVKTPSNILAQAFAFSPAEFLKVGAEYGQWKKGAKSTADFINDISKGLTGTMGLIVGALLAREGALYVGTGDKELDEYDKKRGITPMSIKVGDTYVNLSELMPGAGSVLAGASVYETIKKAHSDPDEAMSILANGALTMGNALTDMTMLNGITDTLSAVRYADTDTDVLGAIGRNIAGNLGSQFLPTLGSATEKTLDETKRSTYTDKTGKAAKYWTQEGKYYTSKVPGGQFFGEALETSDNDTAAAVGDFFSLEPSIDQWGEEIKQQDYGMDAAGRILNNFINPLGTTSNTSNEVDDELRAIYKATGDASILGYGTTASSNQKVDGEKLSEQDWTQYQKTYGSLKLDLARQLMSGKDYEKLEAGDKVEIYKTLESFAKAYTQNQVAGKELTKANQAMVDAYESGGAEAVVNMAKGKALIAEADIRSNAKIGEAVQEAAASGNIEKANEIISDTEALKNYGFTKPGPSATYQAAKNYIPGLTVNQFATTYKQIDANGNQGITQDEIIDYLNRGHYTQAQGDKIWNAYGNPDKWAKIPMLGDDGTWKKTGK